MKAARQARERNFSCARRRAKTRATRRQTRTRTREQVQRKIPRCVRRHAVVVKPFTLTRARVRPPRLSAKTQTRVRKTQARANSPMR